MRQVQGKPVLPWQLSRTQTGIFWPTRAGQSALSILPDNVRSNAMCTFFRRFPATSLAILISLWVPTSAQTSQGGSRSAAPAIREQIDETRMVPLRGNVRSDLTPDRDLGPVEDELPLRLYMVLQRSPAQQAELENLMERQQQPTAAEYHRWITPQQFGEHHLGVARIPRHACAECDEQRFIH